MIRLVGGIELHPCGRIWLWHCFPSILDVLSCTPILELFVMEGKGFLWTQLLDLILPPSPKTQYTISAAGNSTRREKICRYAYLWGNIPFRLFLRGQSHSSSFLLLKNLSSKFIIYAFEIPINVCLQAKLSSIELAVLISRAGAKSNFC